MRLKWDNDERNERLEKALDWCKANKIQSEQLNLFNRQYVRKRRKDNKERSLKMFRGLDIETVKTIKKRLETELEDKELAIRRRTEVEALLYNIDVTIREREKANIDNKSN